MHLNSVRLHPEKYPTDAHYPFNLAIFHQTNHLRFDTPVTFFVGENGTGKSTLMEAITHASDIHIWRNPQGMRYERNPYEKALRYFITLEWANGRVPGSYFSSETYRYFTRAVDEWAVSDASQLNYFGGKSLVTQSHGQSLMSYFRSRYKIRGLYLMDEPETALSPKSQLELLQIFTQMGGAGHAQFLVATHSPILLACPGATIYSFDHTPVRMIQYEETPHFQVYRDFMSNREKYLREMGE
jgi:predicted ATPase